MENFQLNFMQSQDVVSEKVFIISSLKYDRILGNA